MHQWIQELIEVLKTWDTLSQWIEKEREKGRLKKHLPELEACIGVEQNRFHRYDVYHHLLYSCDAAVKKLDIRLAALFHDIGKPLCRFKSGEDWAFYNHEIASTKIAYHVFQRWGLDQNLIKKVTLLIRYHMFHYRDEWSDSAVRRIIRKVGMENLEDLFLLRVADREGNGFRQGEPSKLQDFRHHIRRVQEEAARFKITDLKIGGEDLKELGMTPGPAMGKILKSLAEKVSTGKIENEKYFLREEARNLMEELGILFPRGF